MNSITPFTQNRKQILITRPAKQCNCHLPWVHEPRYRGGSTPFPPNVRQMVVSWFAVVNSSTTLRTCPWICQTLLQHPPRSSRSLCWRLARPHSSTRPSPPTLLTILFHQVARSAGSFVSTSCVGASAHFCASPFAVMSVAGMRVFDVCFSACSNGASMIRCALQPPMCLLLKPSGFRTQLQTVKLETLPSCVAALLGRLWPHSRGTRPPPELCEGGDVVVQDMGVRVVRALRPHCDHFGKSTPDFSSKQSRAVVPACRRTFGRLASFSDLAHLLHQASHDNEEQRMSPSRQQWCAELQCHEFFEAVTATVHGQDYLVLRQ